MIRFQYPASTSALLDASDNLLILARPSTLERALLKKLLPPALAELAVELLKDVKPSDHGSSGSTLTRGQPRRLTLGLLPERGSRYNNEARTEAVHKLVGGAGLTKGKAPRSAVLIVAKDEDVLLPTLNAIGRTFPLFSGESRGGEAGVIALGAVRLGGEFLPIPDRARRTLEHARTAARLVDTPPSELHPAAFSREVRALLKGLPRVKLTEIVGPQLAVRGLGGIHAVGRAAENPPRLIVARYTPARGAKPTKGKATHVALVGKGITFDTGGLHLKPRGSMEGMKSDMGGAAACLMAFRTLVEESPARPISLVLCIAENAIGPGAYKPDDILRLHSGKTVEINNTDAEGRLLLADGVSWAARVLKAEVILDAATLTGAQPMSTGMIHAAVVSNEAELERILLEAGAASGDPTHPLPFAPEFYQAEFKSLVADMKNSVKNRSNAQSSCAAQFVYSHLEGTDVRWGHVDLAGPAFRGDRGTGFGVALLAEAVRRL